MPLDTGLLLALVEATLDTDENLTRDRRDRLDAVALLLASRPRLALAWGQVLTEHTAPEPPAPAVRPLRDGELHLFEGNGYCSRSVAGLDVVPCGFGAMEPIHRVEKLTDFQRDCLVALGIAGSRGRNIPNHVGRWLADRGLADGTEPDGGPAWVISGRGRAWLEAHGGEPT